MSVYEDLRPEIQQWINSTVMYVGDEIHKSVMKIMKRCSKQIYETTGIGIQISFDGFDYDVVFDEDTLIEYQKKIFGNEWAKDWEKKMGN